MPKEKLYVLDIVAATFVFHMRIFNGTIIIDQDRAIQIRKK